MKVSVTTIPLAELDVDLLLVPIAEDGADEAIRSLAEAVGPAVGRAAADFEGSEDSSVLVYPDSGRVRRVALLGMGPADEVDAERVRRAFAEGASFARKSKAATVAAALPDVLDAETLSQAAVEGFALASYRFLRYKTNEEDTYSGAERLVLHTRDEDKVSRRGAEPRMSKPIQRSNIASARPTSAVETVLCFTSPPAAPRPHAAVFERTD